MGSTTPPRDAAPASEQTTRLGAAWGPFEVKAGPVEVDLELSNKIEALPAQIYLRLHNLRSTGRAGGYDVYLDFPGVGQGPARPKRLAGRISLYGPTSRSKPEHGSDFVLDVTEIFRNLATQHDTAVHRARVILTPVYSWSDTLVVGGLTLNTHPA